MTNDVNDRTGRQILVRRHLESLTIQLRLYVRTLEIIKSQWKDQNITKLRSKLQGEVPESSLFPVWELVARAKVDSKSAELLVASIDEAIGGISRCLDGHDAALPKGVLGRWAQACDRYRDVLSGTG